MFVAGRQAQLLKLVAQIRFSDGFAYSDFRGRLVNMVRHMNPGWVVSRFDEDETHLRDLLSGALAAFSSAFVSLTLEADPEEQKGLGLERTGQFIDLVAAFVPNLLDELGISELTRIGTRGWFLFDAESKDDAESWLDSLSVVRINKALAEKLESVALTRSIALDYHLADRHIRIAFNGVESKKNVRGEHFTTTIDAHSDALRKVDYAAVESAGGKVSSQVKAMIDIDEWVADPDPVIEPVHFISQSVNHFHEVLQAIQACRD